MGGRNVHLGDEGRLGYSAASKSKVAAGTRSALLLASALGCSLSIFVTATPAAAIPASNDACGPITASTGAVTVNCTATSPGSSNSFPNGIIYVPTQPVDLTVVLQGGTSGAVSVNSSGNGVFVWGAADHAASVTTYAGANITAARIGIDLTTSGTGVASINNAATVSGTPTGLSAISNGTGGASVTNSGAITVGSDPGLGFGISALSTGGAASVTNSGAITANTGATNVAGINTAAAGAQTVNNNAGGTISVTGAGLVVGIGTYSMSPSSTVTINNAAAVAAAATGATGSAFGIQTYGSQTAVVDLTGASAITATGHSATGVQVQASGNVTVTGAAGTTIAANSSGGRGDGLYANSTGGIATVKVDGVSTTGANTFGVSVNGHNGATVDVGRIANGKTYGVVTTGDNANGLLVYSYNGAVAVTNHGSVQTSGANSIGVYGFSYSGTARVTTDAGSVIHTKGSGSAGITVNATNGDATVTNAGAIVTEGDKAAGVLVTSGRSRGKYAEAQAATVHAARPATTATIVNTGTIVTSGANSVGAYALSRDGVASVTSSSVTTSGANSVGLIANGKYAATVTTGAVTTHGNGADAVKAIALGGFAGSYTTVHITGPIVTTGASGRGVVASGGASVTVDGSGTVTTTGANAPGIEVTGQHINVKVTGAVSATGAGSTGVSTLGTYGSTVTVGKVTANSAAVFSQSKYGAATTNIDGAVVSTTDLGAAATSMRGTAAVTVAQSGSVNGATAGVVASGDAGASVTNHGVIGSASGFAVNVGSGHGTATLVNAADGVINGALSVNGYAGGTFTNAGVWNASGDSTFTPPVNRLARPAGVGANAPAGNGVIDNTGTTHVAPTTTTPVTVTVTGVSVFNNTGGLVDMRNGHAGDVLDLGGAAFNASTVTTVAGGVSTTSFSRLAVDVDFAPGGKADKLVTGQATGTTAVVVQDVNGGGGGINLTGLTVAQAAGGTPAGAFVLGTARTGFVNYSLTFDPTSTSWNLVGLPSHAVFETLKLPQLAQAFAERSDDVWFQRMQEVRDAAAARKDGFEFWGQVYGGEQNLGQVRTFTFGSASFNEDLSTKSSWGGVQVGVDHGAPWRSGRLLWGFTAGYLEQWSSFTHSGGAATWSSGQLTETGRAKDSIEVKGANLGGYLGYTQGGWFLNGLAKVDFGGVNAKLNSIQLNAATNATIWGVNGEFGYRVGGAGLFVEPVIKLAGGDTNVDRLVGDAASTAYPDATNLLATAGARFGGQAAAGPVTLSPWLGAYVADELLGQNRAGFTVGGTTLDLRDQPVRTFARFDVGATVKSAFGVEGFAKAGADTGSGVSGWTANLGVRWRF